MVQIRDLMIDLNDTFCIFFLIFNKNLLCCSKHVKNPLLSLVSLCVSSHVITL